MHFPVYKFKRLILWFLSQSGDNSIQGITFKPVDDSNGVIIQIRASRVAFLRGIDSSVFRYGDD